MMFLVSSLMEQLFLVLADSYFMVLMWILFLQFKALVGLISHCFTSEKTKTIKRQRLEMIQQVTVVTQI